MTFLNVTVCSNSILTVICTTELQNITKIVSWGRPRCSAELVFLCSASPPISSLYPTNTDATSRVLSLSDISCVSVRSGVSVTPLLFAHPHFFCACLLYDIVLSSSKAVFKGCVALRGKPDRRRYLPVRKAALLGVQSGAAAMCWVSFTPSFARRSMFGVLKMQPMPPDIIQRVFQGNKKLYTYLYFWKFLLFEDSQEIFF